MKNVWEELSIFFSYDDRDGLRSYRKEMHTSVKYKNSIEILITKATCIRMAFSLSVAVHLKGQGGKDHPLYGCGFPPDTHEYIILVCYSFMIY